MIRNTKSAKPKETYEMWKERKLIEELKFKQEATETEKLKTTLNERLTEGRKALNELAISNWLKKKQEKTLRKNLNTTESATAEPLVKYIQKETAQPKVDTRIRTRKQVLISKKENSEVPSQEKKEDVLERVRLKDEKLHEIKEDIVTAEELSHSNITNKSRRTISSKSLGSIEHKNIVTHDDKVAFNKQLCKELQNYLQNPNSFVMSDKQTSNKISFEQWLKKKDAEIREKKEKEKQLQEFKEEQRKQKEEMSKKALNEWYLKNAFRMVTNDKFLKNKKIKNKWELQTEMLYKHESESESEYDTFSES